MSSRVVLFIAGPMAVGKSTFIQRFMSGDLGGVSQRLELGPAEAWSLSHEEELSLVGAARPPKILCHLDILHFMPRARSRTRIAPSNGDEAVRVVTLWASPAKLRERIVKRNFHGRPPSLSQKSNWSRWSRLAAVLPRWLRVHLGRSYAREGSLVGNLMRRYFGITPLATFFDAFETYRDPASVAALYESWRQLCVAEGVEQVFIDTTDGNYTVVEQPPWHGDLQRDPQGTQAAVVESL